MAVSNFKVEQNTQIFKYVDQIIRHVSQLQPSNVNYRIAEDFIVSSIQGHTFTDTNENEVGRMVTRIKEKFRIHNEANRAERLDYLIREFKKKKLKNIGISDVHHSLLHLLLIMSNNPTGVDIKLKSREYLNKEELQRRKDEQMEEELKKFEQEDQAIISLREDWEQDMEESSEDSDYASEESDEQDNTDQLMKQDEDQSMAIEEDHQEHSLRAKPLGRKQKKDTVSNQQHIYLGGLPITKIKAPLIKTVESQKTAHKPKPKRFTVNAFLDKYLNESKPPKVPYDHLLENKLKQQDERDKDRQLKLKKQLNIRTFDEIQEELSKRTTDEQLSRGSLLFQKENEQSCFSQPMNTVRDYKRAQGEGMKFWSYKSLTERQIVIDVILLLQGLETTTFMKDPNTQPNFTLRQQVQVQHLSPKLLQSSLSAFIGMANKVQRTEHYLQDLKQNLQVLGTVIESFTFTLDSIIKRFNAELSDLHVIALLQAGQISKSQLKLNPSSTSSVQDILQIKEPLTLMQLEKVLKQSIIKKIDILYDAVSNGIMDYLIGSEEENKDNYQNISIVSDGENGLVMRGPISEHKHTRDQLASLELEKIKPADRVTFLLNYLYLVIKNNQLLSNQLEVNIVKELFLECIQPYISIMSDWLSKGELKDAKQEFFIKANPKIFDFHSKSKTNSEGGQSKLSSQAQWAESYVFRTINLKELIDEQLEGVENKIEISIPIFLRPLMQEILSTGKSIKIIRYLDKINVKKGGFEEFSDFKTMYQNKVKDCVSVVNDLKDPNNMDYYDEQRHQPNQKIGKCAFKNLENTWNPCYSIADYMKESQSLKDYKDLLEIAPFSWSQQEGLQPEKQFMNLFQLPQIVKQTDISVASTQLTDQESPEKRVIHDHRKALLNSPNVDGDVEMKSEDSFKLSPVQPNLSVSSQLLDWENLQKLSSYYSYAQQELRVYESSMNFYQSYQAFDFFMRDTMTEEDPKKQCQGRQIVLKDFSIENFTKQCISQPIRSVYSKACTRFVHRLRTQCRLEENLNLLRQVFFMEAGHQLHAFSVKLFKQMDKGRVVDNLYMVNGHLHECLSSLPIKNESLLEKLTIIFKEEPKKFRVESLKALEYFAIVFQSEWPLEIILDKNSLMQYNQILQFLMKIKRVNYVLTQKDFWINDKSYSKPFDQLNVIEQIIFKNKQTLMALLHRMQVFQRELLHFSNNLEYYIKTRAIQSCCNELEAKLRDIEEDSVDEQSGSARAQDGKVDMDYLVETHQEFLGKVTKLCLLDRKSKQLNDAVQSVLQVCLDFRHLCHKYLLDGSQKEQEEGAFHNDNYDDELGLNLESEDHSKPMSSKVLGRGKLKINDPHFIDNVGNCYEEVEHLKEKFRNMMVVLMGSLKKYTKKGVYSYLDEAFTRLNFNSFYIERDAEGLD